MATKISKNARSNVKTEQFFCKCGGQIKMVTKVIGRRMKHTARCLECGTEKRKPSDFR